jgi:hypothetical protein
MTTLQAPAKVKLLGWSGLQNPHNLKWAVAHISSPTQTQGTPFLLRHQLQQKGASTRYRHLAAHSGLRFFRESDRENERSGKESGRCSAEGVEEHRLGWDGEAFGHRRGSQRVLHSSPRLR